MNNTQPTNNQNKDQSKELNKDQAPKQPVIVNNQADAAKKAAEAPSTAKPFDAAKNGNA